MASLRYFYSFTPRCLATSMEGIGLDRLVLESRTEGYVCAEKPSEWFENIFAECGTTEHGHPEFVQACLHLNPSPSTLNLTP